MGNHVILFLVVVSTHCVAALLLHNSNSNFPKKAFKLKDHRSKRMVQVPDGAAESVVSLYCCGPTVYRDCHIGNFRTFVVHDTLKRWLVSRGCGKVVDAINFTDSDEKLIREVANDTQTANRVVEKFIERFHRDSLAVGNIPANHNPRSSNFTSSIIAQVQQLINIGAAYVRNGSVYFNTSSCAGYLHRDGHNKNFVLWKATGKESIGYNWSSPWGIGRPGWHSECCVMVQEIFNGGPLTVHSGGQDLEFPHHENERAIGESISNSTFAQIWISTALLTVQDNKMAKSKVNAITVTDTMEYIKSENALPLRMLYLSSHYRSPLAFSMRSLLASRTALERVKTVESSLREEPILTFPASDGNDNITDFLAKCLEHWDKFETAMNNDLNTPRALASLFETTELIDALQRSSPTAQLPLMALPLATSILRKMLYALGINRPDDEAPRSFLVQTDRVDDRDELRGVAKLLHERWKFKTKVKDELSSNKGFKLADNIRQQIRCLGFTIEDLPGGILVRVKRPTNCT